MADLDLLRRLSRADRGLAVVAVSRPDGSVQASVVNAGVLDPDAGGAATVGAGPQVAFVVRGNARKLGYIRHSARATVVFRSGWEWVAAEGPARIVAQEYADLAALLRAVFSAVGGTHQDWDTFDRVMAEEHRVAVLVEPARITSNG